MHKSFTFFKTSFFFFLALPLFCIAQGEHNIWYFGENAGIDFNSGTPVALTDGVMDTHEGCGSICDPNGDLLFYASTDTIWDRTHTPMPNGTDLLGHYSSTQGATIVPLPGSSDIYYVFASYISGQWIPPQNISYAIVDMSLNGGMGDVTAILEIPNSAPSAEKITVVQHANNSDYWVVIYNYNSDRFESYLLTATGLDLTPVQSAISGSGGSPVRPVGYMKPSLDGTRLASANMPAPYNFQVYNFNPSTGIVTFDFAINFNNLQGPPYGVEFSPSGDLLYVGEVVFPNAKVYQYNLLAGNVTDILSSRIVIGQFDDQDVGALQLAPDQRMYIAHFESDYLGVINNPDVLGMGCNFEADGFFLEGRKSKLGLPNYTVFAEDNNEETTIEYDGNCIESPVNFEALGGTYDSLLWNFGDPASGAGNTSDLANTSHSFSATGIYTVTLTTYYNGDATTITQIVQIGQAPSVELGELPLNCEPDTFLLDATSTVTASYLWQDLSTSPTYTVTSPGLYWVQLSNACGSVSDSVLYEVIDCSFDLEMPNVFTPNSDLTNDTFHPTKLEGLEKAELIILNRWGEVVFKTEDLSIGWDGTYNSSECPEGTYFWEVNYSTVEGLKDTAHGFVTLVR